MVSFLAVFFFLANLLKLSAQKDVNLSDNNEELILITNRKVCSDCKQQSDWLDSQIHSLALAGAAVN